MYHPGSSLSLALMLVLCLFLLLVEKLKKCRRSYEGSVRGDIDEGVRWASADGSSFPVSRCDEIDELHCGVSAYSDADTCDELRR